MSTGNGQPIVMGTLTNAFTPLAKFNPARINFYLSNESDTVRLRVGSKSDFDAGKGHLVRVASTWNDDRTCNDLGAWTIGAGAQADFTSQEIFG